MKLIPVLDLKNKLVVHARGGEREHYQPVCTEQFPDAHPLAIVDRVIQKIAPDTIYIADLDAIQGQQQQTETITQIQESFPSLHIWLDQGIKHRQQIATAHGITPVIGTETLEDDITSLGNVHYILSLDFKAGALLGQDVLSQREEWPATVIAISMDCIGAQQGPDLERLVTLRQQYAGSLIAGGGVRDEGDIQTLKKIGIDGVLVASAIYNGHIPAPL